MTANANEAAEQHDLDNEIFGENRIVADPQVVKGKFREWAEPIIIVLMIIMGIAIYFLFDLLWTIESNQAAAEERGYKTRARICELDIIDNDRDFALSGDCTEPGVLAYYPPEICVMFGSPDGCGTKFQASEYPDPVLAGTRIP